MYMHIVNTSSQGMCVLGMYGSSVTDRHVTYGVCRYTFPYISRNYNYVLSHNICIRSNIHTTGKVYIEYILLPQ